MSGKVNYGLKVSGLRIGDIEADGDMSENLVSPGKVMKDTVDITPGDDTDTEFFEEGASDPFHVDTQIGVDSGTFDIGTFDEEVIADLCGGTVVGAGDDKTYASPIGKPDPVFKSLELEPLSGKKWIFPRVKITAKLIGRFRQGELNVIRVSFKKMQPSKSGVSSFYLGNYPTLP